MICKRSIMIFSIYHHKMKSLWFFFIKNMIMRFYLKKNRNMFQSIFMKCLDWNFIQLHVNNTDTLLEDAFKSLLFVTLFCSFWQEDQVRNLISCSLLKVEFYHRKILKCISFIKKTLSQLKNVKYFEKTFILEAFHSIKNIRWFIGTSWFFTCFALFKYLII